MKTKFLLLFLLLFIGISQAQTIKGIVFDSETNRPLNGVHVYTKNEKNVTLTNEKGEFTLKLWSKIDENDLIYFSFLGYKTNSVSYLGALKTYKVFMTKEINTLDGVTIYKKNQLKLRIDYQKLNEMPEAIYSFGSCLVGNKIYTIGGDASFQIDGVKKTIYENPGEENMLKLYKKATSIYNKQIFKPSLNIYNIDTDTWSTSEAVFKKRAYHNVIYDKKEEKIYVIGGKNRSKKGVFEYLDNQIEIFDLEDNTITIDNTNPHPGVDFESFIYEDNIIVMGGSTKIFKNGRINYSKKVHFYNTNSGFWYELQDMPKGKEIKGTLIGDKIYVFGGFDDKTLTQIETYDLITGDWELIGNMNINLKKPAITNFGSDIFLFENKKMFVYNINSKELKEYSIDLSMVASEMLCFNQKLYIVGGYIENEYSIIPSKDMYSIDLKEFEVTKLSNIRSLNE
ncbi:Kelch repeat-containing protein [Urechidicola croceus]|uniref:Galactose oxidase n=1 Tax=Urechidicola croceus TaxID=1850246 RepID=A0A1D8P935_9FLAO|nr:carboxypeptidase-like regulatory domain-containing protein [Urechidicola croceus]AOW21075.1 hypothetical protein LPB138_10460 [Urechidicola croceus]